MSEKLEEEEEEKPCCLGCVVSEPGLIEDREYLEEQDESIWWCAPCHEARALYEMAFGKSAAGEPSVALEVRKAISAASLKDAVEVLGDAWIDPLWCAVKIRRTAGIDEKVCPCCFGDGIVDVEKWLKERAEE